MDLNRIYIHIDHGVPEVYLERPYSAMVLDAINQDGCSDPIVRLVEAQPIHALRDEKPELYKRIVGVIGQG